MKKLAFIAATLLFISSGYAQKIDRSKPPKPGPAPTISLKDPVQFKLKNGMTVLVVENHKLPRVSARFMIDRGPVKEGEKAGVMSLMGQMLLEGTRKRSKSEFDQQIDQTGSSVSLSSSGGTVDALTRYFDQTFMLMAEAITEPALEQAAFDKLKTMGINALKTTERSADAISQRVVSALSFGRDHPMGEFQTEETLNNLTLSDVKEAYGKYITPSRSYLTFVGDITPDKAKALAEKAFGNWQGVKLQLPSLAQVDNVEQTEINLIDLPSAVQAEITVVNLIELPMSSPDYFAVLLANQILGGGSTGQLFQNLREKHGFTYGAYSSAGSGRFQTTFKAYASVRNDKVDSAVAEIMKEIRQLRTQPVSDTTLSNAKMLYTGNFALSLENPALPASFAANILINGLDKDFYRNYLKNIGKVTSADVQRVAQKYFNHDNTRIIVVGKASDLKDGLQKLGYPLKMYDKYATPLTDQKRELPPVSTKEIIGKYMDAIGGKDELDKVQSTLITGAINTRGMKLTVEEKTMAPNLSMLTITMAGQPIMKEVFDGTKGWREQMGQKIDYSAQELSAKKDIRGLFNQANYFSDGYTVKLAGTENIAGKDAYKIIVTMPSGQVTNEWYDAASGLLIKTESSMEMQGQKVIQSLEYSHYEPIGKVLFPHTINMTTSTAAGAQEMTMELDSIKVNEGVTKNDFK